MDDLNNDMLIEIEIRCLLPLRIWWHGFSPASRDDWLEFLTKHRNMKVRVSIGITDRSSQIDVINLSKDLPKSYFPGNSLVLTLKSEWPKGIIELLRTNSRKKEAAEFCNDVKEIIDDIYSRVVEHLRNDFGQYWLSPTLPKDNKAWSNAEWLDLDGNWKPVFPPTIHLKSRIRKQGLSKDEWNKLGNLLENYRRPNIIKTTIANAKAYLETDNGRMAVVEVVVGLEAVLRQLLPKLLSKSVSPPVSDKLIDKAIEKMGLRLTAQILFEHLKETYRLDPEHSRQCLLAIERRNEILHQTRRHVGVTEAKAMVDAAAAIVSDFETQIDNSREKTEKGQFSVPH